MATLKAPPPPPRRVSPVTPTASQSLAAETPNAGWKGKIKSGSSAFGKKALVKGIAISDSLGARVNTFAEKRLGTETFWPVTGDMPKEMDKCARILRAFTVDGVVKEEVDPSDPANKKRRRVLRKIPAKVIAECKGLAIFTAFRSGIAPLGGAGGSGVVIAKLPDGSWGAPSGIMPQNLSTGFLIGVDIYDCILIIRSQKALDSFGTHKVTLGTEVAVAAGPYGAGAAVETGREQAPVFSYVRSKGLYAGVELVGQVFVERTEENGAMYHWPGVKARDILAGGVKVPIEAASLHAALHEAETGVAQAAKGNTDDIVMSLDADALHLADGEVLHLPPRPHETDGHEQESDPETEVVRRGSTSLPASGNNSPRRGSGPPPPLPARARPELSKVHSSNSHYSDEGVPPPYESAGLAKEAEWSASDKEWEQHYADQAAAQAATNGVNAGPSGHTVNQLVYEAPPAQLETGGNPFAVEEAGDRLERQHL